MKKTKLLITLAHYLPGTKVGGPVSSIKNIAERLSDKFDIYVLTSDRDFQSDMPYANIVVNQWVSLEGYNVFYVKRDIKTIFQIIKQIKNVSPDIIYLNPFFDPIFSGAIAFANYIKVISAKKLIIAPRGELFDASLDFKKTKKKIFLKIVALLGIYNRTLWHATSIEESQAIKKIMNIGEGQIKIARVIPEKWSNVAINEVLHRPSNNAVKIIYLARISKDKNTPFCFEILKKVTLDVVFDVYGPIEDKEIWEECLKLANELPSNVHFTYQGVLTKNIVKNTLAQYDLFFMPTFSENYGHSIAESLSAGTPVLISDNTPWRNLESKGIGWDLSLASPELFVEAIMSFEKRSPNIINEKRNNIIQKARNILDNPDIFTENLELFSL